MKIISFLIMCLLVGCSFNPRRAVGPDVVKVTKHSNHGTGGTGFYITAASGKTYILTNAHVCGLAENNIIDISDDDSRYIPRAVLEVSEVSDLCLIEGLPGHDGLKLAPNAAAVGDKVYTVGHPVLAPLTVSSGEVTGYQRITLIDHVIEDSVKDKCDKFGQHPYMMDLGFFAVPLCLIDRDSIATDMVIYPGNSGSPAVNERGRVIGVVFAGNQRTNWGFLVPLVEVETFLKLY